MVSGLALHVALTTRAGVIMGKNGLASGPTSWILDIAVALRAGVSMTKRQMPARNGAMLAAIQQGLSTTKYDTIIERS